MDRPLEVRPVDSYRQPTYPGVPVPADFPARRYSVGMLQRFARGLARPFVLLGLYTTLNLSSVRAQDGGGKDPGQELGPKDPTRNGDQPGDVKGKIRFLTRDEIRGLVCGLEQAQDELAVEIRGRVAGQMGFLTEEEGRQLLKAFFRKNGFEIDDDVAIQGRSVEFTVDGYDASHAVGFEFLGPQNPDTYQFQPAETDLTAEEAKELELARVRGERAILVLDGAQYAYNVRYMSNLPSKAAAVDRLLDDVRRFAEWLETEGRLHAVENASDEAAKDEEGSR